MSMISNFRKSTMTAYTDADQEEWDQITDVEFEKTNEIEFCTPKGNKVLFQKVRHGHWIQEGELPLFSLTCSICGQKFFNHYLQPLANYCSMCGAKMDSNDSNALDALGEKVTE